MMGKIPILRKAASKVKATKTSSIKSHLFKKEKIPVKRESAKPARTRGGRPHV
jgi:hypothetical protein